ncbi:hypothetical protein QYM36_019062 [Artemia franciscana]|uniref:Tyrosine specific protein phosphatases domain-containing protein n=1 Tax=Artemia franciscana TaxID=6661 RepID=A0AA88KTX4_ARTSF|nr:hypothetical protein QYM36_019062 [Artemia franciscana]
MNCYFSESWVDFPTYCEGPIMNFIAFKGPQDKRYNASYNADSVFTPEIAMERAKSFKIKNLDTGELEEAKIGLWIDLTNVVDGKRYRSSVITSKGVEFAKILCKGFNVAPTLEQYQIFKNLCSNFLRQNPSGAIGVHCRHGCNRTGFLIVSYLVDVFGYKLEEAIKEFSLKRPPGIYKRLYIEELYRIWRKDRIEMVILPPNPLWNIKKEQKTETRTLKKYQMVKNTMI